MPTKSGMRRSGRKFGTIINVETVYPRTDSADDMNAADKYDLFYNRLFLDPAIRGLTKTASLNFWTATEYLWNTPPAIWLS